MEILKRNPSVASCWRIISELDNKEMVLEWLKLASIKQFDAAVYFDSPHILQTIDRDNNVIAYNCSVNRDNLSRCLVSDLIGICVDIDVHDSKSSHFRDNATALIKPRSS